MAWALFQLIYIQKHLWGQITFNFKIIQQIPIKDSKTTRRLQILSKHIIKSITQDITQLGLHKSKHDDKHTQY